MYRYEDVREVHVELTTRCNAACPQCPRNLSGGAPNPAVPLAELSLEDVRAIFPRDFVGRLRKIYACGNYGDPMVAKDTLAIFSYLREANPNMELGMFTNGSGRTADWWAALAKVTTYVRFSIDGLEDTNHLYRRGTQWARIIDAARAFIAAGGRAEWDFIVFKHNEHQIEEARAFAEKIGFKRFFVKKTSRFFAAGDVKNRVVRERTGEAAYELEPPSEAYRNQSVADLVQLSRLKHTDYQASTEIDCKALNHHRIYVSAEGCVFPCCWTGALYPPNKPAGSAQIWDFVRQLPEGKDSLDARRSSIRDVVEGPFFQTIIPSGWPKGSIADGRLEPCVRSCGSHDTHAAQYGRSLL